MQLATACRSVTIQVADSGLIALHAHNQGDFVGRPKIAGCSKCGASVCQRRIRVFALLSSPLAVEWRRVRRG